MEDGHSQRRSPFLIPYILLLIGCIVPIIFGAISGMGMLVMAVPASVFPMPIAKWVLISLMGGSVLVWTPWVNFFWFLPAMIKFWRIYSGCASDYYGFIIVGLILLRLGWGLISIVPSLMGGQTLDEILLGIDYAFSPTSLLFLLALGALVFLQSRAMTKSLPKPIP